MLFLNQIKQNKYLLLILLLATILRFYHLDFQSLWMDEIYTMNVSNPNLTWSDFHKQLIKREGFPHLYFIVLKLFYFVFGYSSFVARSVSAFAGIACVYGIYLIAKELNEKTIGLLAALLVSINEYQIYISQDARPYSLYFFAVVLSFYRLIKFIKNFNSKNAIYLGLSIGLMLNINFFGLINAFSQAIIILFFIFLVSKQKKIILLKNAALAGIIALMLFAINYQMFFKLLKYKAFWVKPPNPESFSLIFKTFFGNSEIIWFIILPLFIFYFITIFQNHEEQKSDYDKLISNKFLFNFIILFAWFFVFFAFLMIKSYGKISYLLTRYFISISPVLFIVLSISIASIKGKTIRFIVAFSLFFFTVINLIVVKKYYSACSQTQFREATNFVIKNNLTNEKVFTEYKYWYDYYFNKKQAKTINLTFEKLVSEMGKHPNKMQSFWYIGIFKKPFDPSKQTQLFLKKHYKNNLNFDGYQVWVKHFQLLEK